MNTRYFKAKTLDGRQGYVSKMTWATDTQTNGTRTDPYLYTLEVAFDGGNVEELRAYQVLIEAQAYDFTS